MTVTAATEGTSTIRSQRNWRRALLATTVLSAPLLGLTAHGQKVQAQTTTTYTSADTNIAIPASGLIGSAAPSTVVITDWKGTITDVDLVLTNLTHTYAADLDVTLDSPDDLPAEMFTDVPTTDDFDGNYTLDDDAPTNINAAPVVAGVVTPGTYTSENGGLTSFDGEDAVGTWTLQIDDDLNSDSGALGGWQLVVTTDNSGDDSVKFTNVANGGIIEAGAGDDTVHIETPASSSRSTPAWATTRSL